MPETIISHSLAQATVKDFLTTVVTPEGAQGWFVLCMRTDLGEWYEEFFQWPNDLDLILARAKEQASQYDVYFSSHLSSQKSTLKTNVLQTRTIQADLDEADLADLPVTPTVLIETSPGRHQAYWVCEDDLPLDLLETFSQNMTYAIPKCDRSGWPLGHKVRMPETVNYKRLPFVNQVKIQDFSNRKVTTTELEFIPGLETYKLAQQHFDGEWLETIDKITLAQGPLELLESVKATIPPSIYITYDVEKSDRSVALWALLCALFRAGLSRDESYIVARNSANNKFAKLKYHGDLELAKDVLRAEEATSINTVNVKSIVNEGRRLKGNAAERNQYISKVVIDKMKQEGTFIHCDDDTAWFVRQDVGRPVQLSQRSDYLRTMLSVEFGLNEAEQTQHYVVNDLCSYAFSLPDVGSVCALSQYEANGPAILLHMGRKEVWRITSNSITPVQNGSQGYVFPWTNVNESFRPNLETNIDWGNELFQESLKSIIDIEPRHALAILKVWTMFILLRGSCPSRPILALFGQPGSGKSTVFRKVYAFLYGRRRALGAVTTRDDFDYAVSTDALVVLDNLDTWEQWLPDRLALSAASSDRTKRKLYTDVDTVTLRRQAILGITAHNPQFGREDVADRLLILNFKRLSLFEAESTLLNKISNGRNALWGSLVKDLQKVLAQEIPAEYPQFRVEDFAKIGSWIAQGLECVKDFSEALTYLVGSQRKFVLEEDQILVDALERYVNKQNGNGPQWETASSLWAKLESLSPDSAGFARRYRNAVSLGKKLNAFTEPLSGIMKVEQEYNLAKGIRLWRFTDLRPSDASPVQVEAKSPS